MSAPLKQPLYLPTPEEIDTQCELLRRIWSCARRRRNEKPVLVPHMSDLDLKSTSDEEPN
jgi:hypothetical protein